MTEPATPPARPSEIVASASKLLLGVSTATDVDEGFAGSPDEAFALLEEYGALLTRMPRLLANVATYIKRADEDGRLSSTEPNPILAPDYKQRTVDYMIQELTAAVEDARNAGTHANMAGSNMRRNLRVEAAGQ